MFESLSDPVLGKLVGHPKRENWTGRAELREGELVKLVISYSGGEDADLSVEELFEFSRGQLARIRAGIAHILLRAARHVLREHRQRTRPGIRGQAAATLATNLKIDSVQFTGAGDTAVLLTHPRLSGEVVVLLTPKGKVESVEC